MPAPLVRRGHVYVKHRVLRLGLVVNRVETRDVLKVIFKETVITLGECYLEESVKIRVRVWVYGGLKEWLEETLNDVLEALHVVVGAVDVVEPEIHESCVSPVVPWPGISPGDLYQPPVVVGVHVVAHCPAGQVVPLTQRPGDLCLQTYEGVLPTFRRWIA